MVYISSTSWGTECSNLYTQRTALRTIAYHFVKTMTYKTPPPPAWQRYDVKFQEHMAESGMDMDQARYMSVATGEWLMGFSVILLTRAVVRSKMKLCVSAGLDFAKTDSLGKQGPDGKLTGN